MGRYTKKGGGGKLYQQPTSFVQGRTGMRSDRVSKMASAKPCTCHWPTDTGQIQASLTPNDFLHTHAQMVSATEKE